MADPTQRLVALVTTLLFIVLGLAVLTVSPGWLLALVPIYAVLRVVIALVFPLHVRAGVDDQ